MSSISLDLAVRASPKSGILYGTVSRLPYVSAGWESELAIRLLRLNCLTSAFSELWFEAYSERFKDDAWAGQGMIVDLAVASKVWSGDVPLRAALDRRQALIEIDVLAAMCLGVGIDALCGMMHSQFPVLVAKDRARVWDAQGRVIPPAVVRLWSAQGTRIGEDARRSVDSAGRVRTFELPFRTLDREHDMRVAHAEFERRLKERS